MATRDVTLSPRPGQARLELTAQIWGDETGHSWLCLDRWISISSLATEQTIIMLIIIIIIIISPSVLSSHYVSTCNSGRCFACEVWGLRWGKLRWGEGLSEWRSGRWRRWGMIKIFSLRDQTVRGVKRISCFGQPASLLIMISSQSLSYFQKHAIHISRWIKILRIN